MPTKKTFPGEGNLVVYDKRFFTTDVGIVPLMSFNIIGQKTRRNSGNNTVTSNKRFWCVPYLNDNNSPFYSTFRLHELANTFAELAEAQRLYPNPYNNKALTAEQGKKLILNGLKNAKTLQDLTDSRNKMFHYLGPNYMAKYSDMLSSTGFYFSGSEGNILLLNNMSDVIRAGDVNQILGGDNMFDTLSANYGAKEANDCILGSSPNLLRFGFEVEYFY